MRPDTNALIAALRADVEAAKREAARWKADAQAVHYTVPNGASRLLAERDAAEAREAALRGALGSALATLAAATVVLDEHSERSTASVCRETMAEIRALSAPEGQPRPPHRCACGAVPAELIGDPLAARHSLTDCVGVAPRAAPEGQPAASAPDGEEPCGCGAPRDEHGGPYGEGPCARTGCEAFSPAAPAPAAAPDPEVKP
jgi:hypothetical protein